MKNRYLWLLLSCFFSVSLAAQHALSDAILLRQYLTPTPGARSIANFRHDEESAEAALRILWNYAPVNAEFLADAFEDNPFIGAVAEEDIILLPEMFLDALTVIAESDRGVVNPSIHHPTTANGFSVGNLADGLARFLARRTKQELSLAFFNRLKNTFEKDQVLGGLFPNTKQQLWVIDKEIFFIDRYIEVLRESFIIDLKSLPHQSRIYLQQKDFAGRPDLKILVEDVLEISQFLIDGRPIEDWFYFMAHEASLQDVERVAQLPAETGKRVRNMAASLRLTWVLSESLRNTDLAAASEQVWLPPAEVRRALKDPITMYLYLGLLWQQEASTQVVFDNGTTLRDALRPLAAGSETLQAVRRSIESWSESGRELSGLLEGQQGVAIANDSIQDDAVFRFFNGFFTLTDIAAQVTELLFPEAAAHKEELRKLYESARDLNSFHYNIRRKNYVYAIHNFTAVLARLTLDAPLQKELLRYGNFIASVAEARTSEEIAHAIDLFALPPGSSVTKKNSVFSVSLNAYSGLSYGREYLRSPGSSSMNSDVVAFMAPVGFDINVGFGRAGSLSFYTPIIDVGAITAYRLRNDMVADFPELKWENILAPGAFFVYGGPSNLPIALGAGFQKGPGLRRINDPGMPEISSLTGFRFAMFFSIDIPISHFYVH